MPARTRDAASRRSTRSNCALHVGPHQRLVDVELVLGARGPGQHHRADAEQDEAASSSFETNPAICWSLSGRRPTPACDVANSGRAACVEKM